MAKISDIMSVASPTLGAATSVLGSIFGANQSKKTQQRQNAWQSKENEKSRDFNAKEAQKSRDYQSQMYYADRAYNSAKNQSRLYSEAGLNPSLMMSNGAGSMSGQSISAPSASSSASGAGSFDQSGSILANGIGSAGNILSQSALQKAQVDNLNAGSNDLNAGADKKRSETQYQNLVNDNYCQYIGVQIDLASAQTDQLRELTPELKKQINAQASLFSNQASETLKKIEQADQAIANMKQEEYNLRLTSWLQQGIIPSEQKQALKDAGFSDEDIEQIDARVHLEVLLKEGELGCQYAQQFLMSEQGQIYRTQRVKENYFRSHGAWNSECQMLYYGVQNTKWTGNGIKFTNANMEKQGFILDENLKGAKFDNNGFVKSIRLGLDIVDSACNAYGTAMTGGLNQMGRTQKSTTPPWNTTYTIPW